jgi:transcriptional regulator with XRE-family HTH domain
MNKQLLLQRVRRMAGLSQIQLGKRTGISRARISMIECGDVEATAEELSTIMAALDAVYAKRDKEFERLIGASEPRTAA